MNIIEISLKMIVKTVTVVLVLNDFNKQVYTELRSAYDLSLYLANFELSSEYPI